MPKYLKYVRWFLSGLFHPPPEKSEKPLASLQHYRTADPEDGDPRSTATGDDW